MADDKLQVLRPNGKDAEADKVSHDKEMAELNAKEKALKKNIADMQQLSTLQAQFKTNKTFGRIKSLQCSRDESLPPPPPPKGTPEMTQWDGVEHGSAAEEYLKMARGGLDAVHGDTWHYQQSLSVQDAAIGEGIGAALGKLLQLGGRFIGAAVRKVKPSDPTPAPAAAKPASPGDGLYVARVSPKVSFSMKQLDKKAKHSADFGVDTTKKNPQTLSEYEGALRNHLDDPATIQHGTYQYVPDSTIHFNPQTNNVVIVDKAGEFVSGWKLDPSTPQFTHYINEGVLR
jgi:hypothetical protein